MEIRRAEKGDIEGINELLYQVAAIHAAGRPDLFKPASKKYEDRELIELINCDETPIFVAVDGSEVIGYAFCVYKITKNAPLMQDKRTLYIDDLCVDEGRRGGRVGSRLYEYVVNFAKEKGFDGIELNVWAFNESAYRFYERQGMRPQRTIMEKSL